MALLATHQDQLSSKLRWCVSAPFGPICLPWSEQQYTLLDVSLLVVMASSALGAATVYLFFHSSQLGTGLRCLFWSCKRQHCCNTATTECRQILRLATRVHAPLQLMQLLQRRGTLLMSRPPMRLLQRTPQPAMVPQSSQPTL